MKAALLSLIKCLRYAVFSFLLIGVIGLVCAPSVYAATAGPYPSGANKYISASRQGAGIHLDAPISVAKMSFSEDSNYFRIDTTQYQNPPAGTTTFQVCGSNPDGEKNGSSCTSEFEARGVTSVVAQNEDATSSFAHHLSTPKDEFGNRNLYFIIRRNTAGISGVRLTVSGYRNTAFTQHGQTARLGFSSGGQVTSAMSLVNLPLTASSRSSYTLRFQTPCEFTGAHRFPLKWFDADRPPSTTPQDTQISWVLRNVETGETMTSAQFAFLNSQNENQYLGGNNVDKTQQVSSLAGFMTVAPRTRYTWTWNNVLDNNGVQFTLPYSETSYYDNCSDLDFNYVSIFQSTLSGGYSYPQGGQVFAGKSYSVRVQGVNYAVADGNQGGALVVENKDPGLVSHIAGNQYFPDISPAAYKRTGFGFHKFYASHIDSQNLNAGINGNCSTDNVDRNRACWVWFFNALPSAQVIETGFSFQVSESANNGDRVCFDLHIKPNTPAGGFHSPPGELCFDVVEPRKPILEIKESDAQAGSVLTTNLSEVGVCDPSDVPEDSKNRNADITALDGSSAGSKGQYAVSATGAISGFRSENGAGAISDPNLTFNNKDGTYGGFSLLCRPDLFDQAVKSDETINAGPSFNSPSNSGTYRYTGNNITINGYTAGIGDRVTVVANGNVYINGDIKYQNGYASRSQIPSFAIIAKGNIYINPNVEVLEGLYVSNGVTSTCSNGSSLTVPNIRNNASACGRPLQVNGILVAKEVYFRRTPGNIGQAPVAETISFLPELYLAPPPISDRLIDLTRKNQLDLPPVF